MVDYLVTKDAVECCLVSVTVCLYLKIKSIFTSGRVIMRFIIYPGVTDNVTTTNTQALTISTHNFVTLCLKSIELFGILTTFAIHVYHKNPINYENYQYAIFFG